MRVEDRVRSLCEKMTESLSKMKETDYRKPIGIQIIYLAKHRKIRFNNRMLDYLDMFDDPLTYLIDLSQAENGYERFCKNTGYNIRVGLTSALNELDSE